MALLTNKVTTEEKFKSIHKALTKTGDFENIIYLEEIKVKLNRLVNTENDFKKLGELISRYLPNQNPIF